MAEQEDLVFKLLSYGYINGLDELVASLFEEPDVSWLFDYDE